MKGIAESWDDLVQYGSKFQFLQSLIHSTNMQRRQKI